LIHAEVFAALAPPTPPPRAPTADALADQLACAAVAPQARALFAPVVHADDEVRAAASVALAQLTAFTDWLTANRKRWTPKVESRQFGPHEDLQFAREARTALAATPALRPVIDRVIATLERECGR